jgi:hypothetical protein
MGGRAGLRWGGLDVGWTATSRDGPLNSLTLRHPPRHPAPLPSGPPERSAHPTPGGFKNGNSSL